MNNQSPAVQSAAPTVYNPFDRSQFEIMRSVAEDFANSELVPEMYRVSDKNTEKKAIANCVIAISMALRMQADPLMVMQNLIIISGRPTWSSKFLIASVNTCGRFETLKYRSENKGPVGVLKIANIVWKLAPGTSNKIKVTEWTEVDYSHVQDIAMVAYTTKRGDSEELVSSEVSIKMAILEGWYDKNGSKWPNMPVKMLRNRSASFWTNEFAPEISMGMRTEEEEADIIDVDHEVITDIPAAVANTVASTGNKTPFNFDAAKNVAEPDPVQPDTKAPENPEPDKPAPDKATPATPTNDKPLDTLAKVGQQNAAKEEQKKSADAGVQPAFGFPKPQ